MKPSGQVISIWAVLTWITLSSAGAQIQGGTTAPPQASPTPVLPTSGVSRRLTVALGASTDEQTSDILIPGSKADPNVTRELASDLLVMCRIFDKTVARTNTMEAMYDMYGPGLAPFSLLRPSGVLDRFFDPQNSKAKALYVQGYGVVFAINVKFPLKPVVKQPSDRTQTRATDPLWTETREEIFEPHRAKEDADAPVYQPELVDQLKRQVKDAMRYAANIRGMAPDEYVTVVVQGSERTSDASNPSVATLTLRTHKRDADARATGSLNSTGFESKIEVVEF